MCDLYINDYGVSINREAGRIKVSIKGEEKASIPLETLDSITVTGETSVTSAVIRECLNRGIGFSCLSSSGTFLGMLTSIKHNSTNLQRLQCKLYDTQYALNFSKKIVSSKIHNQATLLKRLYARDQEQKISLIKKFKFFENKANMCNEIPKLRGIEGICARIYFENISLMIKDAFKFNCRNRRPPKDPFNAMISFGYSLLFNMILKKVTDSGLNPYFGFYHRDKEGHAALISDLMEEWRPYLVDALVLKMINLNEVNADEFEGANSGYIKMKTSLLKKFIAAFNERLLHEASFFESTENKKSAFDAICFQIKNLIDSMKQENSEFYKKVVWSR